MALLALMLVMFAAPLNAAASLAAVLVVCPVMVWLGSKAPPPRLAAPTFAWLGAISYGVYAIHYPLIPIAHRVLKTAWSPGWAAGILFIALVAALAWVLDRFYDRPARRWLEDVTRADARGGARGAAAASINSGDA